MTPQEAAKQLEVTRSTVYSLCASGQLGHERIGTGRGVIRISADDVARFRESARAKGLAMVKPAAASPVGQAVSGPPDPHYGHVFKHIKRPE